MFWKLQILIWGLLLRGEIPVVRVWPWQRGWGGVGWVHFGLIISWRTQSSLKLSVGLDLVLCGLRPLPRSSEAGPVFVGHPGGSVSSTAWCLPGLASPSQGQDAQC